MGIFPVKRLFANEIVVTDEMTTLTGEQLTPNQVQGVVVCPHPVFVVQAGPFVATNRAISA